MMKFFAFIGIAIASLAGLIGAFGAWVLISTPRPTDLKSCITTAMYHVHLCPTDAKYVKLGSISAHARNAVIVSEDSAFYNHNGFDWSELRESFQTNLDKGEWARGGSTITQQLAKNVYLTKEKSLLRKVREALITVQIEDNLKKDEILEKYLNVVEFGQDLYGIGPAARYYFQKSASELTPAEGAYLAFLLPNPKKYNVSFHKKQLTTFARKQIRTIVERLFRFKKISEMDYQESLAQVDHLFGGGPPKPSDETAPSEDSNPEELAAPSDDSNAVAEPSEAHASFDE
jgi:monofunctional biosynthetic peptidoglycan transglycosylase